MQSKVSDTSWEPVASWYDSLVGEAGGYFHSHVIFPKTIRLLALKPKMRVLDLACGQGVFSRVLTSKDCEVTAVDQSESLISKARGYGNPEINYIVDDARSLSRLQKQKFDRVVCILALQNMDPIEGVFKRVHELLVDGGRFIIVLMHPCFRTPRISGWEIDEQRKLMFRRVDRYLSQLKVPITAHPGKIKSEVTWSFHRPLNDYASYARQAHLYIDAMEEWVSDKKSMGKSADMENLAREEIPLFLAIQMKRIDHA